MKLHTDAKALQYALISLDKSGAVHDYDIFCAVEAKVIEDVGRDLYEESRRSLWEIKDAFFCDLFGSARHLPSGEWEIAAPLLGDGSTVFKSRDAYIHRLPTIPVYATGDTEYFTRLDFLQASAERLEDYLEDIKDSDFYPVFLKIIASFGDGRDGYGGFVEKLSERLFATISNLSPSRYMETSLLFLDIVGDVFNGRDEERLEDDRKENRSFLYDMINDAKDGVPKISWSKERAEADCICRPVFDLSTERPFD